MSSKRKSRNITGPPPWNPEQPYNALPLLPPKVELETKLVLKQCVEARATLGELKQALELIPNPAVLINTLPVLEARASSEIENIVTTADALFRHLPAEEGADPASKEALRYRHALLEGFASLESRPLTTRTAEAVCGRIHNAEMRVRRVPGTALANPGAGKVIYTPPDTERRLRTLLSNWERFLHEREELDPLVRMATAHYQFEAIHPFTDGNGRTGRILNILFLVEQELIPLPVLYLSRYLIAHKADYYRLLLDVTRNGSWEPWLLYMLKGVTETAAWTTQKIGAIRQLMRATAEFVSHELPKIYSRELIDVLFEQPYCRIGNVVEAGIVGRQAASRYLQALASVGVLEAKKSGRDVLFVHPKLLRLLTRDPNNFSRYR